MSPSPEVATLGLLLGRLERLNEAVVASVCRGHDVAPAEMRVLAFLRHGRSSDGVRPTEISRWIVQTTGGLTATLGRLEESGRIERVVDPDDGRGRRVTLTEAGRAFYDEVFDELNKRYVVVLEHLDIDQETDCVRSLVAGFERASGLAPIGEWDLTQQRAAQAGRPPSTRRMAPVVKLEASEAK